MIYLIVTLIKGEAKKVIEGLISEVSQKFEVHEVVNLGAPPHLTLKYGFETENIEEVETVLSNFCSEHQPFPYKLQGFGSFDHNTLFVKVIASKEIESLHQELIKKLKKIKWLQWNPNFDAEKIHFHATIEHTIQSKEKFEEIKQYLEEKHISFEEELDNITILKLEEGSWKVHKTFLLKA